MENVTFEKVLHNAKSYICDEKQIAMISSAYKCATKAHKGQKRQSGEEYIIHPIAVAFILSEMSADADTIAAALLHDTIEDSDINREEIALQFNENVANLVDGVTKISRMNFSSKEEEKASNTRKIITSLTDDVRIIIIKLADRLHNMRTLQYKEEFKQKENAIETMEVFVPLAYFLGAYRIKNELENLSLKYLKPNIYSDIEETLEKVKIETEVVTKEMLFNISNLLTDENIPHEIKKRTKNIYGVYKALTSGKKMTEIHDLLTMKIVVNTVKDCYISLMAVHHKYPPINRKFKDYIAKPKTNMYSSLHTTVFGNENHLVQAQIRTFEMDKIASLGLMSYWGTNKENAGITMQNDLKTKFQFFKSLTELSNRTINNEDFIIQVKNELFATKVYVYTPKGDIIELPLGSTPIDFAYKIHTDVGNNMVAAVVNEDCVDPNYILKNKDRVRIVTNKLLVGPKEDWTEKAYTTRAKRKIKESLNKGDKYDW